MKTLLFFTDRYPFSDGETFIESEIQVLSYYFNRIIIIPTAMMLDTSSRRKTPDNVIVLKPPISSDIFISKPSKLDIALWAIKHLFGWSLLFCFTVEFRKELLKTISEKHFSFGKLMLIIKRGAPSLRNYYYYRNKINVDGDGDIYIYSYWLEPTIMYYARMFKKNPPKRIVSRAHAIDLYSERNSFNYLAFQEELIKKCDAVGLISQNGFDYINAKYPQFREKYYLKRLGTIDFGLGSHNNDRVLFRIVSCSHIIPLKRVNLIIDGIAMLEKKTDVPIEWIHFGKGTEFESTREYANRLLSKKVKFCFKGAVSNSKLMEFYANNAVDLFISTSETEGLPVSIMEAVSFGIPAIATDVGGTNEVVLDNINGYLLHKDFKIEQMVELILSIINNPKKTDVFRKNSREIWMDRFQASINFNDFAKFIENGESL